MTFMKGAGIVTKHGLRNLLLWWIVRHEDRLFSKGEMFALLSSTLMSDKQLLPTLSSALTHYILLYKEAPALEA